MIKPSGQYMDIIHPSGDTRRANPPHPVAAPPVKVAPPVPAEPPLATSPPEPDQPPTLLADQPRWTTVEADSDAVAPPAADNPKSPFLPEVSVTKRPLGTPPDWLRNFTQVEPLSPPAEARIFHSAFAPRPAPEPTPAPKSTPESSADWATKDDQAVSFELTAKPTKPKKSPLLELPADDGGQGELEPALPANATEPTAPAIPTQPDQTATINTMIRPQYQPTDNQPLIESVAPFAQAASEAADVVPARRKPLSPWKWILLFLAMAIIGVAAGALVYQLLV